jgi:hypothetical protein
VAINKIDSTLTYYLLSEWSRTRTTVHPPPTLCLVPRSHQLTAQHKWRCPLYRSHWCAVHSVSESPRSKPFGTDNASDSPRCINRTGRGVSILVRPPAPVTHLDTLRVLYARQGRHSSFSFMLRPGSVRRSQRLLELAPSEDNALGRCEASIESWATDQTRSRRRRAHKAHKDTMTHTHR